MNNKEVTDTYKVAEQFNRYYISNPLTKDKKLQNGNQKVPVKHQITCEFTMQELKQEITNSQVRKQLGPDEAFLEYIQTLDLQLSKYC